MSGPAVTGAHCGKHPAVAAVELCARCGTFLCGDCVEYVRDEIAACSDCAPLLRGVKATVRARLAPIFSSVGVVGIIAGVVVAGRPGISIWGASIPFGLLGVGLAVMELRLMRGATVMNHGRRWALAGLVLGVLFLLELLGLLALFGAFITNSTRA